MSLLAVSVDAVPASGDDACADAGDAVGVTGTVRRAVLLSGFPGDGGGV